MQTLNSVAFGGLLFLLSAGFSLIFGLLRIPNLAHGALFMLGAYLGATLLAAGLAVLAGRAGRRGRGGLLGVAAERLLLRRLAGNEQGQVLVTLGISFIIADLCLLGLGRRPAAAADAAGAAAAAAAGGLRVPDLAAGRAGGRRSSPRGCSGCCWTARGSAR